MNRRSFLLSSAILPSAAFGQNTVYPNRWVYFSRNLGADNDVEDFRVIAQTSAAHGLNGIMLATSFDNFDRQNDNFRRRLSQIKQIAADTPIELIPAFYNVGYAGGLLSHNRNLAEGIPVKGALFTVRDGEARLTPDPDVNVFNSSFETFTGDKAMGYQLQDSPGSISFVDSDIKHGGGVSLRFENLGSTSSGNARIMQEIAVRPNRCYRVSVWVRTENLQPANAFLVQVLAFADGRALAPWNPNLTTTQDWTKLTFAFNSSKYERIRLYAGTWGGRSGKFWVDDWLIEEVGLINVLRRSGTPLRVEGESNGTVYEEGVDFAPIADPQLNYRWDHDGTPIRLLPDSRIGEGERLRVSFYHAMSVLDSQVSACMSEPEAYDLWQRNARLIQDALAPKKWMLSADEIRSGGTCDACKSRNMTMGQILGDHVTRGYNMIKDINPDAEIYVWSDMFDPNHNAVRNYYLVDGDYTGSWQNIPPGMNIVLWYYAKRNESLAFFSGLGFKTTAGAYYDANDLTNPKGWLNAMKDVPGASGIMYTTWENKYGLLAGFGDLVSNP